MKKMWYIYTMEYYPAIKGANLFIIVVLVCISLITQLVKNLLAMQETRVQSLGQEDLLEKGMAYPLQYSCLEFHGQYGPWGRKESDMAERLSLSHTYKNCNSTKTV